MPQTHLDLNRASHAWDTVQTILNNRNAEPTEEKRHIKKLPSHIISAGLGQALAFLKAKGYAGTLRSRLDDWMATRIPPGNGNRELLQRIIHGDADFMRRATAEVLEYLAWLKRFAEAEIASDD